MRLLYIFLLAIFILPVVAQATVTEQELSGFCAKAPKPRSGQEFDGSAADAKIMALKPGTYKLQSGDEIILFTANSYIVRKASGAELAGCSKEQLSEILRNNKISTAGLP